MLKERPTSENVEAGSVEQSGKADAERITKIAQKAASSETLKRALAKTVETIDGTSAMTGVRKAWSKLPEAAQFALVHGLSLPGMPGASPLKVLIRAGLLEYKRTPTEKDLASFADDDKTLHRMSAAMIPQLKEIAPLLGTIENAKESVFSSVRKNVLAARAEREDASEVASIQKKIRRKV